MPIITFYSTSKKETGNSTAAIAYATYLGITKNKKTLLISTEPYETATKESLWPIQQKKRSGLFGPNTSEMVQNGIEELDRVIRSNRVSPEIITNYTRVALRGRLEALTGFAGIKEQFEEIQKDYPQIVMLAGKNYDSVIVDISDKLDKSVQAQILTTTDIIVATTTQEASEIEKLLERLEKDEVLDKKKTIIVIGRYDDKSKYNAKNITRGILKQKKIVNTIPYSTLLHDSMQEGKTIETMWDIEKLKTKDDVFFIIEELRRLDETIENKVLELQMKR